MTWRCSGYMQGNACGYIEGSAPQYLNSIFGKNEILVSKWSWQHQVFQCSKILTPTRTVFTQYTNVWSLPGNLPCCTALIVLGNNILTPDLRYHGHRVYMGSAGGLFCVQRNKILTPWSYDNVALKLFFVFSQNGYFGVKILWHWALDIWSVWWQHDQFLLCVSKIPEYLLTCQRWWYIWQSITQGHVNLNNYTAARCI